MNRALVTAIVLITAANSAAADKKTPLQLKGVTIGDASSEACLGAPLTSKWEEQAQALRQRGIGVKSFGATECAPPISPIAGLPPSEPPHIMLFDDKVVFFRFTLEAVPLERQGDILGALKAEFGPWQASHSTGFSHFRWKKGGTDLEVERTKIDLRGDDLNFFLRDSAKMRAFQAEVDRATKLLEKQISEERGKSVLQKD